MKNLSFLFIPILLFCSLAIAQNNVAVLEIERRASVADEISRDEAMEITNVIRSEAVRTLPAAKFNIMTSETVQSMSGAVLADCADESCIITIGRRIDAEYIVRGTLSKFQTRFTLNIEMFETEYGNLIATADPIRSENLNDILDKSAPACADMYRKFLARMDITPESQPPQATAPPVSAPATYTLQAEPASEQVDTASVQVESASAQVDTVSVQIESASAQVDTASVQTESLSVQVDDTTSVHTGSALILSEIDPQPEPESRTEPESAPPPVMSRLGQPGRLDGIAAVVGGEIILHSEVEAFAFMRLSAMGGDPDQIDIQGLLRECLDELIDNKVLLVRAMEDSTINVRNDEVESMLNNHINSILRQNRITMEQFEELLRQQQGTTIARFRTEARRAIREQLYKQKLQQTVYFSINVNRNDVERFFAQYADSLPEIGESFELLKLSLRLASSDSVRQAAHDQITGLKRRIDAGESFEDVAKELGDPSGGDLGYLVKGSTTEIMFEERAFNLPVGRVSEPFETRLGFHIILVEEKRDMRVKLRQIMVRHAPTDQQREALIATLDSLRRTITTREEFEAAAKAMSVDPVTRTRGGDMGWMSLLEMPPDVRNAVQSLEEGQISDAITEENKLSIYMVNKRVDSRRLTLENDYTLIADKARDILAQKHLIESVKKWRERVFIDVRI